jgi:hypothetical protein
MGILDEAIREHLDLKRKHGAGDSELQKLEDEAFGPPARPGEAAPVAAEGEEAPPEPAGTVEQPAMEHPVVDPAEAEVVRAETEEHPPPEPPEDLPEEERPTELYEAEAGEVAEEEPVEGEPVDEEFFSEQSLSDELDQALDAPEGETAPAPPEGDQPAESDSEEGLPPNEPEADQAQGEGGEDDDVLEETPEFLQDTPEHDRLWFEQKPPKDFDFDD